MTRAYDCLLEHCSFEPRRIAGVMIKTINDPKPVLVQFRRVWLLRNKKAPTSGDIG